MPLYNNKTTLITLDELKALSPMSVNVDDDKLINSLLYAQDNYISKALGTPLYNQIIDQVTASTITAANLILLNGNGYAFGGIRVCLAWYAYWASLTYINYNVTRKGLVKKFDPNSETIGTDDFNIIKSDALTKSETYLRNLIDFLEEDAATDSPVYPLYTTGKNDGTTTNPQNASSGIAL